MALLALEEGHEVVACLHPDLHGASTLEEFLKRGGEVLGWRRGGVARLQKWEQMLRPNFSDAKLGNPDLILLSCGSLPAITYVPGLIGYLKKTQAELAVLCLFNAEALAFSASERQQVGWLLEKSRANIFVADQNRRQAVRQFGVDLQDAHVFYGPLRERFDEALPMPPWESGVVFSCVARLDLLWKAQDILLEVLGSEKWLARNWRLRIYGTGVDRGHIEKLVRIFHLVERVEFRGFAKDMREIWWDSHLMVLPSRGEGTPLATLEAMMCGRPVVTTDVGGNREVLEEGVTGWIAEAATPASFDAALERAWNSRTVWTKMGVMAHANAVNIDRLQPSSLLFELLIKDTGKH